MAKHFLTPIYGGKLPSGEDVQIDVTNSISAGLTANHALIREVGAWMTKGGHTRVLDFGAGALRHTLPLLRRKGMQVISVEYAKAFERRVASAARVKADKKPGFTGMVWPDQFLKSSRKYDVALLTFVLQVIPVKDDRVRVLKAIAAGFDRDGPRRLYYASRFGIGRTLSPALRFNDGWVQGRGKNDRSFYTEWNAAETDALFEQSGYVRVGTCPGVTQGYIFRYGKTIW